MHGRLTGIVLGAGASACYSAAPHGIPTQRDIVGRLFFGADTSSGEGFPSFTDTFGLRHSMPLAAYLRARFAIPERADQKDAKLDFWQILQERGMNLEGLYGALEDDSTLPRPVLESFEAILRSAVLDPTDERGMDRVCRYHRMLCEALEPGDYIINFNWDSVMADALLWHSHFWFPATGFGIPLRVFLPRGQKSLPVQAAVTMFHVHGSAVLFEPEVLGMQGRGPRGIFVGPKQWSPGGGMMALAAEQGADPDGPSGAFVKSSDEERRRLSHGWVYLRGQWFRPVFVPPSKYKPQHRSWYGMAMRSSIHSALPQTERLVIAGYSFPVADLPHLRSLFVPEVMPRDMSLMVVNPSNEDSDFRQRVAATFPSCSAIDFSVKDFKLFCETLLPDPGGGSAS